MARILLALALLLALPLPAARAQSPIQFGPTRLENEFPDRLTFEVEVSTSLAAGEIVSAKLYHALLNANSTDQELLTVQPDGRVTLQYTWDTSNLTIPPSAPVLFHWEATDSAGNRASSTEELFRYDDVRFDWSILDDERIAVWWHDQPAEMGERVFEIAQRAINKQYGLFQAELDYQIRVIIYNDFDEFAGWHAFVHEFVGGQAFTSLGITAQIVDAYATAQEQWLNDVIPHEIAHLYFFQVTYHPLSDPPLWLNEGVAQYNEFRDHQRTLDWVHDAIRDGNLIRLKTISGSFGSDVGQVRLSYAESLSAVTYLVEAHSAAGLANLMKAYGAGKSNSQAFQTALNLTPEEFELAWLEWLGIPADMYPTPTPWPTLAPLPSPAPPTGRPPATATPTTTRPQPTITAEKTEAEGRALPATPPGAGRSVGLCASAALPAGLLFLGAAVPLARRRAKP